MYRVFTLSQPLGRHLWALLIYSVLALVLTWPLVLQLTTHVPGDGIDDPALAWNLWWLRERVVDQANLDIFHAGWMFHPISINLAFYTLTPLNGLLSIALQSGLSLILASNLLLLSTFVLGAYGTFLLVLDQSAAGDIGMREGTYGRSIILAALVGGLFYGLASSKLFYASLGQFNIASSQWIPFCMLYLLRMTRPAALRVRLRNAAFAALFLTFQFWAELTYGSFLLLFVAIVFVWQMLSQRRAVLRDVPAFLAPYLLLALLVIAGLAPFLWAMLPDMRAEGDFFASGGGFADIFSADVLGYLVPTRLHPIFGEWVATLPFPNDKGQHIFLGYTIFILAAIGFWTAAKQSASRSLAWLWGVSALLFLWLTLGPSIRWAGADTGIPGPFALLSQLPFFSGNRYPSRYSVMLMVSAAVLGGFGLAWLLEKLNGVTHAKRLPVALAGVVVAGAFLFEHLATPLPLSDFRIPGIYARLAAEPGDFAVLELPTGWRNGARVLGKSDLLIMMQQWYQTEHGKRRLGGNTSRNPEYKFQYFTQAPLLGDLIALMNADRPHIGAVIDERYPDLVAAARPAAGQILHDLGVRYVLMHEEKSPPQLLRFVEDALPLREVERWQGTDWSGAPATIVLYAVEEVPRQAVRTLSLVDDTSSLYLGEGWSSLPTADGVRYATRPNPVLLLDLPEKGGELTLDWVAPVQEITIAVNGRELDSRTPGAGQTVVSIPPGVATDPVDRVEVRIRGEPMTAGQIASPAAEDWPVGTTGATLPAASWVVVRSAGEETGDFAHIFVNGQDIAQNERGYNLAAISPAGDLLVSAVFDTSGDDAASGALAGWLEQWPPGTIIAGAVADEASLKLGEEAVAALQRAGVSTDLRGRLRWGHAFVGAVGAEPGAAVETSDLLHPVAAAVGSPVDGAEVFGGLRSVTIRQSN